jgi:hypothetical protein
MPPLQSVPVPPESVPTSTPPTPQPESGQFQNHSPEEAPRKKPWTLVIIILLFIITVAGASYAYFEEIAFFSRPPYDPDHMAQSIVNGLANIETSEYTIRFSVASEPREADARPFSDAVSGNDERQLAYKRDQDTVRALQPIVQEIRNYFYKNRTYPASLAVVKKNNVIAGATYKKTTTGFELRVPFETSEAVQSLMRSQSTTSRDKILVVTDKTSSYFSLPQKMPQAGLAGVLDLQTAVNYIPSDFNLDIGLTGAILNREESFDNKVGFDGKVSMGDFNVALEAEFRKIGSDMFVIVHKMPTLFADMSKIKGKWIKVSETDIGTYGSSYLGTEEEELDKKKEDSVKAVKLFLTTADKNHALVIVGKPVKEKINGQSLYRYDLRLNKETIVQFYTELTNGYAAEFGNESLIKYDQSLLDYLESPNFNQVFDYLSANTSFIIWADGDGTPIQTQFNIRVVPDSDKNKNNQVRMKTTLSFDKVNSSIKVDLPEEFMTVEDATILLSGLTREEYRLKKQLSNISTLQSALSTYKSITGTYPLTLSDLTKRYADLKKAPGTKTAEETFYSFERSDDYRILKTVPIDVFHQNDYGYSSNSKDFMLTYSMELPAYKAGMNVGSIIRYDYKTGKYGMAVVNGKNTADSKTLSREAGTQSQADGDGDMLTNVAEVYLGTDVTKKDTDKDGYSDGEEFRNGDNPLGPGKLGGTSGSLYY